MQIRVGYIGHPYILVFISNQREKNMPFPKKFVWGAATASYQIEGGAFEDGRGASIWDTFSHTPGKTKGGDTGDVACDSYHRWAEDMELMKALHLQAYRFSIAWPRIFPAGTGAVNPAGLAWYDRFVDALLAAGIEPYVTLYHWDLPQALQDKGGWLNADTARAFAVYAATVAAHFKGRVKYYFTLNEPQCSVGLGYSAGVHAPGYKLDDAAVFTAWHNTIYAHCLAADAIRKADPDAKVGMAPTGDCCLPKDDSPEEVEKARQKSLSDYPGYIMSNTWWADPVFLGQYPAWAKEKFGDQLYTMTPEEWALVSQPLDFYAYNCYQGTVDIVPDPSKYDAYAYQGSPQTAAAWNITPKVLYHASKFWFERYHLPILITENGYSGLDCVMLDGEVHDPQRIDFLHRYLLEVARAMADGIPVIGYSVWSLFDNFEWAAGYSCRYGLIYVDYPTQQRIVKDSGWWYRDVIASNGANL